MGATSVSLYIFSTNLSDADILAFLDQEVRSATGRSLGIEGDISIKFGLVPVIEVEAVSLGNVAWGETPAMLKAERLYAQFSLLPLLNGRFVLEEVSIVGASLFLETDAEGRNNWDFGDPSLSAGTGSPSRTGPSVSDQISNIVSSLLSITSHVDEFYINEMSVRYTNAGAEKVQIFDIARVGLEATDQDHRLVLDIGAGAVRRGQSLHLEIYDGNDFLNRQGSLGLALSIDADTWKSQVTGALAPDRTETQVDLDMTLDATDVSAFYADVGELVPLPPWPTILEPSSLDFRAFVIGNLDQPDLDQLALSLGGKHGSSAIVSGQVKDVFGNGALDGQLSATIADAVHYGPVVYENPLFWNAMKQNDPGNLTITGNLGGQIVRPLLKNATVTWGEKEDFRLSAAKLSLGTEPFTLSTDLSLVARKKHFLFSVLSGLLPPSFADLRLPDGDMIIKAHLEHSLEGQLDAENIDVSIDGGTSLQATLSGRALNILDQVAPDLKIVTNVGDDRLLHEFAAALAPDDWPQVILPLAPLYSDVTLVRNERDKLELVVANLEFGNRDIARLSGNGVMSDFESLTTAEINARVIAKDGPRLRQMLETLIPDSNFLNRLPSLDEISLTASIQRDGQELTVSSAELHTGGALPMMATTSGVVSLAPSITVNGSAMIEGQDLDALRDMVFERVVGENVRAPQPEQSSLSPARGYRLEGTVRMEPGELRVERFFAELAESRLAAELQITNSSDPPHVKLSISDMSVYLPGIIDLLTLEGREAAGAVRPRIFDDSDFDLSGLASFDMALSATGEVIGIDSPIFDSLKLGMDLTQGHLLLNHFLGTTTKGKFSLKGDWNVAGAGAPEMAMDLDVDRISLGSLLHRTEIADWLRDAPMSGTVKGHLKGMSPADLAASFTGQVNLSVGPGEIDQSVIDWLGGDLISTIYNTMNPFAKTTPYSQLLCAEARLPFVDGVSQFEKKMALETKRVALMASGRIDLGQENIDLSLASTPKEGFGPTLGGSLIRLKGRLDDPNVSLDAWGASKKAISVGTSILTGGVSSLLEAIFDRISKETNLCQVVSGTPVSQ